MRLDNGTVLMLHPVAVYGDRAVAFAIPVGAGVADATAYSRHGEIAAAIPFNGSNGMTDFGYWLTPGQHALDRTSGQIGSGTANGTAWSVTAYLGPWGTCFQFSAVGTPQVSCVTAPSFLATSNLWSFAEGSVSVGAGGAPASTAWVIVNQSDGTTTKVWPVTIEGQKLFAFQLLTAPSQVTWTDYDNSGAVVGSHPK